MDGCGSITHEKDAPSIRDPKIDSMVFVIISLGPLVELAARDHIDLSSNKEN